jgi:hypothetical protein
MKTEIQEGAIVDSQIKGLKLNECFKPIIDLKHISPASLDLITEEERYRISRMTLPKPEIVKIKRRVQKKIYLKIDGLPELKGF